MRPFYPPSLLPVLIANIPDVGTGGGAPDRHDHRHGALRSQENQRQPPRRRIEVIGRATKR